MYGAGIAGEMIERVFALTIRAELIPRAWGRIPTPWAFIAHIAPEPRCLGLLGLQLALQFDRRVIGEERGACPDQFADVISQWL